MTKPTLKKPSKVERARTRLDAAVVRLEGVLKQQGGDPAPVSGDQGLARERDALLSENSRLKEINETVSARLDGAIGRLNQVIGEA